ncbi:tRNA pseudouridine(55) synthase TruB [Candidatus Solincola tengchongensis]|uniref:tRNA pseudouridine(55) synthase TruB n=1 Tax=Candidatus Solincola tengchongensis TaxID=2900693 RepID=UPI00257C3B78|nr:tRNA pseudouridine(55) synthase TruB [Candidatus Solincola tengchongensis]
MAERSVDGLVLLDKPPGPTSHDLVQEVKKRLGAGKAGHAGTLDPQASGLMVVLTGRATRLAPFVPGDPKVYEGTVILGLETETLDLEGKVTSRSAFRGSEEEVRRAVRSLVGSFDQEPPRFSAVKHRGKPLYYYARRGEEVPRKPRRVEVYESELLAFRPGEGEVDFRVSCSPGTYVRELAQRLGKSLGCGGTLARLRRLASGPFRIEEALTLEELSLRVERGEPGLLSPLEALRGLGVAELRQDGIRAARHGAPLMPEMLEEWKEWTEGEFLAVTWKGELVGVYEVEGKPMRLRPMRLMV